MSRRIVGVEMDVWTAQEVEEAVRAGAEDAWQGHYVPSEKRVVASIMARLKGERA